MKDIGNRMTGWVIYYREDYLKNKKFVQFIREGFAEYNIDIRVIVLEEQDVEELLNKNKPGFVINRSRDAKIAKHLYQIGIRVFNHYKITEIANDKERTYKYLTGIVPYMPLLSKDSEITDESYIIKSCNGHGGHQVFLVRNDKEKKAAIQAMNGEKYVIQECSSDLGKDVRVYIIGNKVVQAMLRTSTESFKSNYSLGGAASPYVLNQREIKMVENILERLPLDYGGIDFIFHHGKAVFNEIEDAVGARMIYENTDIHIIKLFVDYIVNELKANK